MSTLNPTDPRIVEIDIISQITAGLPNAEVDRDIFAKIARDIISKLTAGLSKADAKELAFSQQDSMCMIYGLMSPLYEEMAKQFPIEQWQSLSMLSEAWLKVAIEHYGEYVPAL